MAGGAAASARRRALPRVARAADRAAGVTEVPLLYETGGDERFDKVVVITAPKALREARREPLPGDRETRLIDDKEKVKRADYAYVNTGSLEELDRFVGSVVEDLSLVRRLLVLCLGVVAAWRCRVDLALAARRGQSGPLPAPLQARSSRGHARNYRLEPGAARRGDRRGVEVQGRRKVNVGRDRARCSCCRRPPTASRCTPAARVPTTTSTTRRSMSATARGTCGTCSTSTTTSERRSPPTTRARTTSTAGCAAGSGIRFTETRAYVAKVEKLKGIYRDVWGPELSQ